MFQQPPLLYTSYRHYAHTHTHINVNYYNCIIINSFVRTGRVTCGSCVCDISTLWLMKQIVFVYMRIHISMHIWLIFTLNIRSVRLVNVTYRHTYNATIVSCAMMAYVWLVIMYEYDGFRVCVSLLVVHIVLICISNEHIWLWRTLISDEP